MSKKDERLPQILDMMLRPGGVEGKEIKIEAPGAMRGGIQETVSPMSSGGDFALPWLQLAYWNVYR